MKYIYIYYYRSCVRVYFILRFKNNNTIVGADSWVSRILLYGRRDVDGQSVRLADITRLVDTWTAVYDERLYIIIGQYMRHDGPQNRWRPVDQLSSAAQTRELTTTSDSAISFCVSHNRLIRLHSPAAILWIICSELQIFILHIIILGSALTDLMISNRVQCACCCSNVMWRQSRQRS